ncbi:spore germination protein [Paenibacillus albicereus]|uniref:Spore germination protein n=1 Tax=Paenibacillus albicereus TaxID=2726185 RepID=A0A6H2GUR9_9BACL|nr:spore germination protein [Paenibacillus albicereus]QJC51099.1 spore germination protein [Paenibacillus albicereus]
MPALLASLHTWTVDEPERSLSEELCRLFAGCEDYICVKIGEDGGREVSLCYLTTLASPDKLRFVVSEEAGTLESRLSQYEGSAIEEADYDSAEHAVCLGMAILCLQGSSRGLVLNLHEVQQRSLGSPFTENVLQGPLYAFNENLDLNTAIVRQRIRSSKLKSWTIEIGGVTRTKCAVLHLADKADPDCLRRIQDALGALKVEGVQDTGELLRLLDTKRWARLFPKAILTERPDRVSIDLLQGKLAILLDGTPFALLLPAVYTDFWHSPEDRYVNPFVSVFLNALRFLAMLCNLTLPALYIALTSINVDVNRLEISLAAAASREGVPYPVFVETMLMLIIIDFITEAGTRLPNAISATVTMVGGVVLGQAIIQASIVSNLLVIIVAATAITNFIVIDYQMGLVQRILKYFACIGAAVAGLLGIVFCLACLVFYLSSLESFGTPYLTPLLQKKGGGA